MLGMDERENEERQNRKIEKNNRKNEIKMTREKEGKEKQKVDKNKRQQRESNNEQG